MAAFNKSENEAVIGTGLSNASRGAAADESLGALFKGVGDTLQNTLNAFDESTKVKIEMMADEAVNGPQGAVAAATPDANGNLPPGAQESLGAIAGLRNALSQGAISQVTFDREVARHATKIRMAVPKGYGPEVERKLSAAVGASTANQARQTELAAMDEARKNVDAGYTKMRSWMDQEGNNKLFFTPNVQAFVERATGRKMPDIINNPDEQSFRILQEGVMRQRSVLAQQEIDDATIKHTGVVTDDVGSRKVDQFLRDGFNKDINIPWGDMIKAMDAASAADSPSGAGWDGNEAEQVVGIWRPFRVNMINGLEAKMAELNISDDARTKMRSRLNIQLDAMEKAITDKNTGAIYTISNQMSRNVSAAAAELLRSDSGAFGLAIMKEAGFPDAVTDTVARFSDPGLTKIAENVSAAAISVLTNRRSVKEVFSTMENFIPPEQMGQFNKQWIEKLSEVLNTDKNDAAGVALAAKNLFDEQNDSLIASLPMEARIGIFQKLMSPNVVNKLIESQDVDALNAAARWGEAQFKVISRRAEANMVDGNTNRYNIQIVFDGDKFLVKPRQATSKEFAYNGTPGIFEMSFTKTAVDAVQDMNKYVATMKPIWDAQKKDVSTALGFIMQRNINEVQHEAPILQQAMEGLYQFINGGDGKQSNAGAISGTAQASVPKDGEKPATAAELDAQVSPNPTSSELENLPSASVMKTAAKQLGMNERDQNAALKEYLQNGGINLDPATTAWCAAYVNATLAHNGIKGTGSNLARSFLTYGEEIDKPREGDIVVFSRGAPGSGKGHVGFFKGFDKNGDILVLGGNQGNSVSVKSYAKAKVLGYRRIPGHNRNIAPDQLNIASN